MLKHIKILIWLNVLLALTISLYSYYISDKIPDIIPIHFNFYGDPDYYIENSGISLFAIPLLVWLITILMAFLYSHPQYSHPPISLYFELLPREVKIEALHLNRRFLTKTFTMANLLLVYIYFEMSSIWLGTKSSINTIVIIAFIIVLIFLIIMYSHQVKVIINHFKDHHHDDQDYTH